MSLEWVMSVVDALVSALSFVYRWYLSFQIKSVAEVWVFASWLGSLLSLRGAHSKESDGHTAKTDRLPIAACPTNFVGHCKVIHTGLETG